MASWMEAQPLDLLFTAAVCQAEILSSVTVLPTGRRREALEMGGFCRSHSAFFQRLFFARCYKGTSLTYMGGYPQRNEGYCC